MPDLKFRRAYSNVDREAVQAMFSQFDTNKVQPGRPPASYPSGPLAIDTFLTCHAHAPPVFHPPHAPQSGSITLDEFELLLAKIGVAPLKDPLKRGSASKDVVKGSVRDA